MPPRHQVNEARLSVTEVRGFSFVWLPPGALPTPPLLPSWPGTLLRPTTLEWKNYTKSVVAAWALCACGGLRVYIWVLYFAAFLGIILVLKSFQEDKNLFRWSPVLLLLTLLSPSFIVGWLSIWISKKKKEKKLPLTNKALIHAKRRRLLGLLQTLIQKKVARSSVMMK